MRQVSRPSSDGRVGRLYQVYAASQCFNKMNTLCIEYWERLLGGLNCSSVKKMAAYEEGCFGYVNVRQAG
jgi:hypothetical protein